MRIGPWLLGAGLLLLAAGVVSSRADAWDTRIPALTIPLPMDGIDTIDIRGSGIEKVVISSKGPAQARYPEGRRFAWQDADKPATPPACEATDGTLRCKAGTQFLPGTPTMQLPPGRYRLLAGDVAKKYATGGMFDVIDAAAEQPRYVDQEISFTAPLYGPRMWVAKDEAAELENEVLRQAQVTLDDFAVKRLRD